MNVPRESTIGKIYMQIFFDMCFYFDRFTEKYNINGIEYRTLTKVYGLRFVLSIRGKGRRFDIVHLFIAIGMYLFFVLQNPINLSNWICFN
jgi:hypothetical protein